MPDLGSAPSLFPRAPHQPTGDAPLVLTAAPVTSV